jgi:hypothetical protein
MIHSPERDNPPGGRPGGLSVKDRSRLRHVLPNVGDLGRQLLKRVEDVLQQVDVPLCGGNEPVQ